MFDITATTSAMASAATCTIFVLILDMASIPEGDPLPALRAENARLVRLLVANGISWTPTAPVSEHGREETEPSRLSTDEKVSLFSRLFCGRTDVYPVRWESKTSGKAGYAPACANEWRPGVCEKPRIKCGDCGNRQWIPLTDEVIYKHLAGYQTLGTYPLLNDDTCNFLAVDFDESDWKEDALAFVQSCTELGVPSALEVSRSGEGAHVWIFFDRRVSARDARRLGTAIFSHTCARTRVEADLIRPAVPNQDTMPRGGLGNLIALPLQRKLRESGRGVFVDAALRPTRIRGRFWQRSNGCRRATSSRPSFELPAACILSM